MIRNAKTYIEKFVARTSGREGFSLAELIIVVLISTFLIGGMYSVLSAGKNSWEINRDRIEMQQELRKGLDWMRKDIRQAGVSMVTGLPADGTWYTTIVFQTPTGVVAGAATWSGSIQYTVNAGQLIRTFGGANRVIAQNMFALQFRRTAANPSIVQISATARKNTPQHGIVTITVTTQERMRN